MCNEQEKIKSFADLDKFPQCSEPYCFSFLEIQNRFRCLDCEKIFCNKHRLLFNHNCTVTKSIIDDEKIVKKYTKCYEQNCNKKLTIINQFECKRCNKKFCTYHRHDFAHKCIK